MMMTPQASPRLPLMPLSIEPNPLLRKLMFITTSYRITDVEQIFYIISIEQIF